jgi:hypothetical protein
MDRSPLSDSSAVEWRLASVCRKLGVSDRTEVAIEYFRPMNEIAPLRRAS